MDLKIKDVAELLRVSETTIRRWLMEGKIPAYKLNHQYRFNRTEIEHWLLNCRLQKETGSFFSLEEEQIYPQKKTKKEGQDTKKGLQQFSLFRAVHRGRVFTDVQSKNKEDLIHEIMHHVSDDLEMDPHVLVDLLLDREKLMPTAWNHGIAVPHARDFLLEGTTDIVFCVFPKTPIDWGALDKNPVHAIFFIFACDDKRHLHLLAKLAHLGSTYAALKLVHSQPSKQKLLDYIKGWEYCVGER
ncbi:MAG: PTS sugar transporter subunit IIA [Simkaniaceae bacterium]|nr:PTS sugar transporter subunit IIA [Simkaniaceae bacterium]